MHACTEVARREHVGDGEPERREVAHEARPAAGEDGGGERRAGVEAGQDAAEQGVRQRAQAVLAAGGFWAQRRAAAAAVRALQPSHGSGRDRFSLDAGNAAAALLIYRQ